MALVIMDLGLDGLRIGERVNATSIDSKKTISRFRDCTYGLKFKA